MLPETILDIHSLLSFFVVLFCTFLWIRSRRPSDLPPGPNPLPILGNIFSLKIAGGDLRKVCEKYSAKCGPIFSLSLGSHWVIFVNGLEAQREVFVTKSEYFFLIDQKCSSSPISKPTKVSFFHVYSFFYINVCIDQMKSVNNVIERANNLWIFYNCKSLQNHEVGETCYKKQTILKLSLDFFHNKNRGKTTRFSIHFSNCSYIVLKISWAS